MAPISTSSAHLVAMVIASGGTHLPRGRGALRLALTLRRRLFARLRRWGHHHVRHLGQRLASAAGVSSWRQQLTPNGCYIRWSQIGHLCLQDGSVGFGSRYDRRFGACLMRNTERLLCTRRLLPFQPTLWQAPAAACRRRDASAARAWGRLAPRGCARSSRISARAAACSPGTRGRPSQEPWRQFLAGCSFLSASQWDYPCNVEWYAGK